MSLPRLRLRALLLYYSVILLADPVETAHDGPSIVALKYRDGLVLAAHARSTTSSYQPHHLPDTIQPVADNVLIASAGGERADVQQILPQLQQPDPRRPGLSLGQRAAALRNGLDHIPSGEILLVGIDECSGRQAHIYSLIHGALLEETEPFAVAGADAAFLTGGLSQEQLDVLKMDEATAVQVCLRALQKSRRHGGPIQIYILSRHQPMRYCVVRPGAQVQIRLS